MPATTSGGFGPSPNKELDDGMTDGWQGDDAPGEYKSDTAPFHDPDYHRGWKVSGTFGGIGSGGGFVSRGGGNGGRKSVAPSSPNSRGGFRMEHGNDR